MDRPSLRALAILVPTIVVLALARMQLPDRPGVPADWRLYELTSAKELPRRDLVRAIQLELLLRGFDPGRIDGVAGPLTAAAVAAYATSRGEPAGRELDHELLLQLRFSP